VSESVEAAPGAASRPTVLVVEDDHVNRKLLLRMLHAQGYDTKTAEDGESALAAIAAAPPDLVLLDVGLPGIDGFEVCRRIKHASPTRLIPVVLVTGMGAREHRIAGIHAGADDFVTKPFDREELQARMASLIRLKQYTDELESAESVILSLALTVEARDAYTEGHCQRLARYAMQLGRSLELSEAELAALYRGGYLHDVGKIGIPDVVLLKPAALTDAEYALMKQHPLIGERLCGDLRSLRLVRDIVRSHHERRDGSGYPAGLRGDQIPILAEIVGIADTFDAVTTTRPYRDALPDAAGFDELRRDVARGAFRQDLVERFIALQRAGRKV
jgi:putative two-component system response regulator